MVSSADVSKPLTHIGADGEARIVDVSDKAATDRTAIAAKAYWASYAASKAALEQMAEAWAIEVSVTPLKVKLFDPGPMATRMRIKAFPGEAAGTQPGPEDAAKRLIDLILEN